MNKPLQLIILLFSVLAYSQENSYLDSLKSSLKSLPQNDINILNKDFDKLTISKQYIYPSSKILEIDEILKRDSLLTFTTKSFLNSGAFSHYNWIKIKFKK